MTSSSPHPYVRLVGALATLACVALPATASAQAAPATSAQCTGQFKVSITPGFSLASGSGTITSHGESGTISCIGTLAGHRVTGPGTVGLDERYARGDCLSHVGTGTATLTVPTTAGPVQMAGAATSRRTGVVLQAEVEFPDARFSGAGLAIPLQGSCLISPMRQALITVSGMLRGT